MKQIESKLFYGEKRQNQYFWRKIK